MAPNSLPRIAILGWGSLLWDENPSFDQQHGPWEYDGPMLRLEFSRISDKRLGALTLVIDPRDGCPTTVAWCLSNRAAVIEAIGDLRQRERCNRRDIGCLVLPVPAASAMPDHEKALAAWSEGRNLDAVVWAGLPPRFTELTRQPFSVTEALRYMRETLSPQAKGHAFEYIQRAPHFVNTPLRRAVKEEAWFIDLANKNAAG